MSAAVVAPAPAGEVAPAGAVGPARTDERHPASYRRSPHALGRLILLVAAALVALGLRHLMDRTVAGLDRDLDQALGRLPEVLGALVDAAAVAVAFVAVAAGVVVAVTRRAWLGVALLLGAVVGGFFLATILGSVDGSGPFPTGLLDRGVNAVLFGVAAGLTIVSVFVSHRWLRIGAVAFAVLALVGGGWGLASVVDRVLLLSAGGILGALLALAVGTPTRRPDECSVREGLAARGLTIDTIERHGGDARGSVPWVVTTVTGTRLFVKVLSDEERFADLLFRAWRRMRLRRSGDPRPHASLRDAVEHESLAALRAASAGVPVPRVVGMGELLGADGVFVALEAIDGRSLDVLVEEDGPDALTDAMLRAAWSMVRTLHRAGIAHRDLRSANLVVDTDGQVWMVDFAFADVFAPPELLARDLVELLASTAHLVGPERAVDAAVATLGHVAWDDALPFVQPLAMANATRQGLGRQGVRELRTRLARAVQAPEPDLPRLGRIDLTTVVSLLVVGAAVWALLPQIAGSGDLWEQIPQADPALLALAGAASLLTYVGASLSIRGSVADPLPPARSVASQLASSFTNRVTPAKVGGLALNVRWLVKEGVEASAAAAAVSVNAVGGLVVHVVLTVFVVIWAGGVGFGEFSLPSARTVLMGAVVIGAVVLVTWALPPLRRVVRHRVVPRARQSLSAVADVAAEPRRLVMLFGGSVVVSACYVAALALSLRAMDADVALSSVALVYLAGSALATAAPTPGGLGATEAVFAAALTSVGVEQSVAIPAVLLYRLVTFWLPIVPGWVAFTVLQRTNRI